MKKTYMMYKKLEEAVLAFIIAGLLVIGLVSCGCNDSRIKPPKEYPIKTYEHTSPITQTTSGSTKTTSTLNNGSTAVKGIEVTTSLDIEDKEFIFKYYYNNGKFIDQPVTFKLSSQDVFNVKASDGVFEWNDTEDLSSYNWEITHKHGNTSKYRKGPLEITVQDDDIIFVRYKTINLTNTERREIKNSTSASGLKWMEGGVIEVQKGQTLSGIVETYNLKFDPDISVTSVVKINNLKSADVIQPGDFLRLHY